MSDRTIREYVLARVAEGLSLEAIVHSTQQAFPHKICGRGYILRLAKDARGVEADTQRSE